MSTEMLGKIQKKFPGLQFLHRNSIQNFVNKVRTTGMLMNKKPKYQHQVSTQKLNDF